MSGVPPREGDIGGEFCDILTLRIAVEVTLTNRMLLFALLANIALILMITGTRGRL